jgi:hypothetical protein
MNSSARDRELRRLYRERDAKFDEIVFCLGRGLTREPASLGTEDWKQLVDDAEELTDNWATAEYENRLPIASTELQRLLSEHQEICKRIIEILDSEQPD